MKINAIQCSSCKDIIFSRASHDFHYCSCGKTAIDGGFEYVRVCYDSKFIPIDIKINVKATKKELYDDWNKRKNKFGIIKKPTCKKDNNCTCREIFSKTKK